MDHHCPWINNCVGHGNYKYFVLFLLYTVLTCLDALLLLLGRAFLAQRSLLLVEMICMWILGVIVGPISILVSCLLSYHVGLMIKNKTTIEYHSAHYNKLKRRPGPQERPDQYDVGILKNFIQVLGPAPQCWFFPTKPVGDGCSFPRKPVKRLLMMDQLKVRL